MQVGEPGMASIFKLVGEILINNEKANSAIDDTTDKASKSHKSMNKSFKEIGETCLKVGTVVSGAAVVVGTWFYNLAENTREYRVEMGKLDTAFVTNGHSSAAATKTYKDLNAVLGDTEQAVEAANHLAKLTTNEQQLSKWTDICTGIYATFGASLPIEGLTEAANETAKVGQVTGPLADALNWTTISTDGWSDALGKNSKVLNTFERSIKRGNSAEDAFNEALKKCSSEQERQEFIMLALNSAYGAAAEQYKTTNAEILASNKAHDNLNAAMAALGEAAEPAVTMVINAVAKLAEKALPLVEGLASAVLALGEAWETLSEKMKDISASITVHTNGISAAASSSGAAVTEATGSSFWGSLADIIVKNSTVNPDAPLIPGFASGIDRVPYDMLAMIHKDEAVLRASEAAVWRGEKRGQGGYGSGSTVNVTQNIQAVPMSPSELAAQTKFGLQMLRFST